MPEETVGEKALDIRESVERSVIDRPNTTTELNPLGGMSNTFMFAYNYASEIIPWGGRWLERDKQLRNYITKEPYFASGLNIMCQRNAGFSWKLDGPPRKTNQIQYVLETANMGRGWQDLVVKLSVDLYTQDNGAFIEIVRAYDSEEADIIGLNSLDAQRCRHTGNWQYPVVYFDRHGKAHKLPWYSVAEISEMPSAVENLYGMQYCALSRMLTGVQIQNNYQILAHEKSSGRETREIHIVKGITTHQLNDAIADAQAKADNQGLFRYSAPVLVGSIDPTAQVGHDSIKMADYPEHFDSKLNFDHYINLMAMAFSSDYQDFAPLPGGGLGTGNQSEMLHLKSRGKGPARFMKLISYIMNFMVMPSNVTFFWDEQDLEAEKLDAEVRALRAQTRATRINSMEIYPEVARQIANDEGDLDEEYIKMMGEIDLTENTVIDDNSPGENQNTDSGTPVRVLTPRADRAAARTKNPTASMPYKRQANP